MFLSPKMNNDEQCDIGTWDRPFFFKEEPADLKAPFIWPSLPIAGNRTIAVGCAPEQALRGAPRPVAKWKSATLMRPPIYTERSDITTFGHLRARVVMDFDAFADAQLWVPADGEDAVAMRVSASRVAQVSPWLAAKLGPRNAGSERIVMLPSGIPASGLKFLLELLYRGSVNQPEQDDGAAALAWLERLGVTPGFDHPWRLALQNPGQIMGYAQSSDSARLVARLREAGCARAYGHWLFESSDNMAKAVDTAFLAYPPEVFVEKLALLPNLGSKFTLSLQYQSIHEEPWPDAAALRAAFGDLELRSLTELGIGGVLALKLVSAEDGSALFCKLLDEENCRRRATRLSSGEPEETDCSSDDAGTSDGARDIDSDDGGAPGAAHPLPTARPAALAHAGWQADKIIELDVLGDVRLWLPKGDEKSDAKVYLVSASRLAAISPFFAQLFEVAFENNERDIVMKTEVASVDGLEMLLRLLYGIETDFSDFGTLREARRWLDYFQVDKGDQSPWHWLKDRFYDLQELVLSDSGRAMTVYEGMLGEAFDAQRWADVIELGIVHRCGQDLLPRLARLSPSQISAILCRLSDHKDRISFLATCCKTRENLVFSAAEMEMLRPAIVAEWDDAATLRVAFGTGLIDANTLAETLARKSRNKCSRMQAEAAARACDGAKLG